MSSVCSFFLRSYLPGYRRDFNRTDIGPILQHRIAWIPDWKNRHLDGHRDHIGRFGFSRLGNFIQRINDEDVFILLTVGIAMAYGGLAMYLGLSEVLGAFLAGMMLAETKRMEDIEATTIPLRDLLLPLFFLSFGTTISLKHGIPLIGLLITLLIWGLIAKVLVGMLGGKWYGLSKRVSMRAGLFLTPRGEFSVVIASLATGTTKTFSGIYVLLAAIIGIVLFIFAPQIANKIYGKPKKIKKKIKVPDA
ncbi:cation:proton antiporter [Terrilactibacillus sp. S3-3]|nr:cation:proton antiporter [Terrilactibacillus sp. S3-3]